MTGNAIPNNLSIKNKREKGNESFCDLGLTEGQNALQNSGERSWDSKEVTGEQRQIMPSWNTL